MAFIQIVQPDQADGLLKKIYEAAVKRAGRVFQILRVMSLNPPVLRDSMTMYQTIMMGNSEISRAQREMLAVVVSFENECHY